jgi:hypothetical protein
MINSEINKNTHFIKAAFKTKLKSRNLILPPVEGSIPDFINTDMQLNLKRDWH